MLGMPFMSSSNNFSSSTVVELKGRAGGGCGLLNVSTSGGAVVAAGAIYVGVLWAISWYFDNS